VCCQSGAFGNIFKLPIAFVQVQFVALLVAAKEQVGQLVVVDIADGYPTPIKKVSECIGIESFGVSNVVTKVHMGFRCRQ